MSLEADICRLNQHRSIVLQRLGLSKFLPNFARRIIHYLMIQCTREMRFMNLTGFFFQARVSEMKIIEEDFKSSREDCKSKDDRIKSLQHEVCTLFSIRLYSYSAFG